MKYSDAPKSTKFVVLEDVRGNYRFLCSYAPVYDLTRLPNGMQIYNVKRFCETCQEAQIYIDGIKRVNELLVQLGRPA